jgi:hypothetical protein
LSSHSVQSLIHRINPHCVKAKGRTQQNIEDN